MRARRSMASSKLVLICATLACGGGGGDGPTTPTPPTTPTASAIAAVSGSGQTGTVESALSASLVAKVTSNQGTAMSGITVTFATASGNGSVSPGSAVTDASGNASTVWTLGTQVGTQTATASVTGLSGSPVTFTATAIAPTPSANTVTITAPGDSVDVGIRLQFRATVTTPAGTDITATTTVTWISSDTAVATVSEIGFVRGIGVGATTIKATAGAVSATKTISVVPSAWVYTPTVIRASDYGQIRMSDPGLAALPGGGFRMYLQAGGAPRSAVSSEGLAFTPESASANPVNGLPRPVALPGGGWKVFTGCNFPPVTANNTGICSWTTTDGVNFTIDPGVRITLATAGFTTAERLFAGDVVKTATGYRIYFSDGAVTGGGGMAEARKVLSATSTDLVTWSVESGIRAGGGGTAGAYAAEHPGAAVVNGKVVLVWFDHGIEASGATGNQGLWYSVSSDGLTFSDRKHLIMVTRLGGDPTAIVLPNGTLRVYFSNYDCPVACSGTTETWPGVIGALTNSQLRF